MLHYHKTLKYNRLRGRRGEGGGEGEEMGKGGLEKTEMKEQVEDNVVQMVMENQVEELQPDLQVT